MITTTPGGLKKLAVSLVNHMEYYSDRSLEEADHGDRVRARRGRPVRQRRLPRRRRLAEKQRAVGGGPVGARWRGRHAACCCGGRWPTAYLGTWLGRCRWSFRWYRLDRVLYGPCRGADERRSPGFRAGVDGAAGGRGGRFRGGPRGAGVRGSYHLPGGDRPRQPRTGQLAGPQRRELGPGAFAASPRDA